MLTLIEEQKGVFALKGEYSYFHPVYKSVEVDGEIYHKTIVEQNICDMSTEKETSYINIDIDFLGLNYKIKDYEKFNISIYKKADNFVNSENDYIALYQILYHNKVLDKRIVSLYCGKTDLCFDSFKQQIGSYGTIYIAIDSYGFNNYVVIEIKLKDFVLIKNKKQLLEYDYYKDYFYRLLNINIDKVTPFEFSQALLNFKINFKKRKL